MLGQVILTALLTRIPLHSIIIYTDNSCILFCKRHSFILDEQIYEQVIFGFPKLFSLNICHCCSDFCWNTVVSNLEALVYLIHHIYIYILYVNSLEVIDFSDHFFLAYNIIKQLSIVWFTFILN